MEYIAVFINTNLTCTFLLKCKRESSLPNVDRIKISKHGLVQVYDQVGNVMFSTTKESFVFAIFSTNDESVEDFSNRIQRYIYALRN